MKYLFCLALGAILMASCGDASEELTSVNYARNFAPVGVEAKVRNNTNVELSWTVMAEAAHYIVEVYEDDELEFDGTPIQTLTVLPEEVPYTVTGLMGETWYSFRVKSVDANAAKESKWSTASVETGKEQIFKTVADEDIKAKQVTLRWPAGEAAATITLTPGDIEYTVTDADIAAGAATITGLTPETEYTAVMKRSNGLTRGTITFTTAIDLAETDILVKEGESIVDAINNAPEGYRLVVMPGTYPIPGGEFEKGGAVKVSKKLAIKGLRPNDMPIIMGRFQVEAEFSLDQVVLDGTGTDDHDTENHKGGQTFDFSADGEYESFSITNSVIKNYTKGFYYLNKATLVKTITIENNIIEKIECDGGDLFDARKGGFNTLSIKNNTIIESAKSRDFIRMDDNSSNVTASANVIVDHNTLYNVGSGGANYRMFYLRWKTGNTITFTNNLVVNTNYKRGFANNSATDKNPTLEGNFYYNTANLIELAAGNTEKPTFFDSKGTALTADPFKDAANGDFTITSDAVNDAKAGAPRWIK